MKPIISIITPYLNAEKFISRFVSSLHAQTRDDWVCIMVDDGSTDGGPRQLHDLVSNDIRFKLLTNTFHKSWSGPASARNFALKHVQTPLIAFYDIDDIWHPEKLERQLSFHIANNLDLSVSAYGRFLEDHDSWPLRSTLCPPRRLNPYKLRGRNPIPMLTVIISTDLASVGFKQVAHEDFLFWLDLFRSKPLLRYGCLPTILAFYCIHSQSLSSFKSHMPFWAYRVFRSAGYPIVSSAIALLYWGSAHICAALNLKNRSTASSYSVPDLLRQSPINL